MNLFRSVPFCCLLQPLLLPVLFAVLLTYAVTTPVSSTGADIGIPGGITRTAVSVLSTVSRKTEEMATTTTTTTTTTSTATTKTIFLVRHAESDENRRLHSLKKAFKDLTRFALPKSKDVLASCELIRIDQQIDSNVSQFGKQQIAYMANTLRESDFVAQQNVQLLVHSPLLRAKETCRDLFGCVLSNTSDETSPLLPPPQSSSNHHNITEVIELDLLTEMTPMEWIPGNAGSLQKRMSALETWLSERPETTIVCVGHSQYFKALLRLPYKFQNCDVIRVQFDPFTVENTTTGATKWSNIQNEHLCRITPTSNDTCHQSNNHSSTPLEKESDSVVAK